LALDEPNDDDTVFNEKEFTFCINTGLLAQTGAVKIDLSYMGFSVESANPMSSGGSSCGGCSSAGNCG